MLLKEADISVLTSSEGVAKDFSIRDGFSHFFQQSRGYVEDLTTVAI